MPFGEGRPGYNITETEIRYAMSNTKSNHQAARFLRISYETYSKYAKLYLYSASGKNLFELHKNIQGKGMRKGSFAKRTSHEETMQRIFDGKRPTIKGHELKAKLIRYQYVEEKCALCGFEERRAIDYSIPLVLDFKDGDRKNFNLENLQLVCYNCMYLTSHNPLNGGGVRLI
jgi:hypothetical protein